MKTKILYATCPHCDYENTFHTNRKYRKGLKTFRWPSLEWTCEDCGKKFDSQVQWLTLGFEGWCAFWLYHHQFNWKIPGIAFLACGLFVGITFYLDVHWPLWFQAITMLVMFIGFGAGFLLLREIPYAYPVQIVNYRQRHYRPR